MSQSRTHSLVEVCTGTFVGTVGSWLISYASYSCIEGLPAATTVATIGCTAWSLARGYVIRRAFNARLAKMKASPRGEGDAYRGGV